MTTTTPHPSATTPVVLPATDDPPRAGILRTVLATVGLIVVGILAVVLSVFIALVSVVAHGVGVLRRRWSSRRTSSV